MSVSQNFETSGFHVDHFSSPIEKLLTKEEWKNLLAEDSNLRNELFVYLSELMTIKLEPDNYCKNIIPVEKKTEENLLTEDEWKNLLATNTELSDELYHKYGELYNITDPATLHIHKKLIRYVPYPKFADRDYFEQFKDIEGNYFSVPNNYSDSRVCVELRYKYVACIHNYKEYVDEECFWYYLCYHSDEDVFLKIFPELSSDDDREFIFATILGERYENLLKYFCKGERFELKFGFCVNQITFQYLQKNFPSLVENTGVNGHGYYIGIKK